MAKNNTYPTPRGQVAIVCEALTHKDGYTAQELLAEAGGVTPHNAWSLARIADRFGFKFSSIEGSEYEDGLKRYFFVKLSASKPTTAKKPAKKTATKAKAVAASIRRAPRKTARGTKVVATSRKAAKAAAKSAMRKAVR